MQESSKENKKGFIKLLYEFIEIIGIDIIVVFLLGIFFAIIVCRILFCDDGTTQDSGVEFTESMEHAESSKSRIDNAKESVERIQTRINESLYSTERIENGNREIGNSLEESKRIIEEIKKQRIEE